MIRVHSYTAVSGVCTAPVSPGNSQIHANHVLNIGVKNFGKFETAGAGEMYFLVSALSV